MKRVALLIDGGHLRVLAKQAGHDFGPDFIERFSRDCIEPNEDLIRVLYYDCAPFSGTVRLPVSGKKLAVKGNDAWLRELAARDLFAVRLGVLKFRGFSPRQTPLKEDRLTDDDFKANYEQKGVDMRIGLDIANFASMRSVDRILLVSGDTDCVPAMKHARIAGLQVVLVEVPRQRPAAELTWHADIRRLVKWPTDA
jgi:uncharacterized LabA/DUF88 family protein